MGFLSEQLLKAGLVSPEKVDGVVAEKKMREKTAAGQQFHQLTTKSGRPASFDRLEFCGTIAEFKDTARKILSGHPEEIGQIINLAHRFKDAPGGKKLIWLMYQVRDGLVNAEPAKREQFLRRAFRKCGGTIEIP